jgi:hypothetical protein
MQHWPQDTERRQAKKNIKPGVMHYIITKSHRWCSGRWRVAERSGQTKDYKTGLCCFSTKHVTLKSKSKDWLARNQDHVSERSNRFTRALTVVSVG